MMTRNTARKVSRYVFFSGPYFPVLVLNTGKCRLEKIPHLDTFQAKKIMLIIFLAHIKSMLPSNRNQSINLFCSDLMQQH